MHNYYYYISETRLKWIPRGHTMVSILSGCGYVLNVKRRTTSGSTVVITVMGRYIFNAGQCWSMLVNVFIEELRRSRFITYQETCIRDRTP